MLNKQQLLHSKHSKEFIQTLILRSLFWIVVIMLWLEFLNSQQEAGG